MKGVEEGSHSGLVRSLGKRVRCQSLRGFESLILRNDPQGLLNAVRVDYHCVRIGDEKAGVCVGRRGGVAGFANRRKPVTESLIFVIVFI